MTFQIDWQAHPDYIHVVLTGPVTTAELFLAMRALFLAPTWVPGSNVLWDGRRVTVMDMDVADYEALTQDINRFRDARGRGRSAMLVLHGNVMLVARYIKAAGLRFGPETEREVFASLDAAEAWLQQRARNG